MATEIFLSIEKDGEVPVEISLQYTTAYTENIYTFVNNINTIEGGTHLEGFKRGITKVFNDYARAHNILKEKDSFKDIILSCLEYPA